MRTIRLVLCASILTASFGAPCISASQVVLPPVNMGGTSFMDGVAGPGVLIEPGVLEHYHADRFVDSKGVTIPGRNSVDTWANIFHVARISGHRLLGGFYGAEVLVPFATVNIQTDFGPKGRQSGVGDILVSPLIIQWAPRSLFGRTFFSRASAIVELPTGAYEATDPVNVGSNAGGVFAYYSFTYFLKPRVETSWRINYRWNATNSAPFLPLGFSSSQAGQAVHANYAVSYEKSKSLRIGANGYFLQQITEHRVAGKPLPNSRERVAAFGPGAVWSAGFWSLVANADFELLARNRPEGYRLNVTLRRVLPMAAPGHSSASAAEKRQ